MERHPVDLLSLITGSLLLGLGLLLMSGGLSGLPMEWAGPAVAIGLGVVILVAARPPRPPTEGEPASADEA
jgi:hypothetical protein